MSVLAALLLVFGQVDLPLTPAVQFGPAGSVVEVELHAEATTPHAVAAIDAILSWDPTELKLIGPVAGSFGWFIAGFLPDPDGINASVQDGDALYTALSPPASPLVVPPNIIVVKFEFEILAAGGGEVTLLPSLGLFGKTRVISTTPGVEITGDIGGPVCIGIPGSWTDLGRGIPGAGGQPVLTGAGEQACEALTTIALTNAKPSSVAYLPIGITTLNLPLKGGILVPNLDLILILVTSPTGDVTIQGPWPNGIPAGFSIYYQYWLKDPTAIKGWQASNGLRSTTGI